MFKSTFVVAMLLLCHGLFSQIQLNFSGTPTITGTDKAVGAKYTFTNVGTDGAVTLNAVIEIISISGAIIDQIDASSASGGTNEAFQPVIAGSATSGNCWSVRFRISFYNAATSNPVSVSSFKASGVDIDGNGSTLREYNTFYYPYSYTLNNPTDLIVTNNSGVYQFRGPSTSYAGIDLNQPRVAVTCLFTNRQSIDVSIGACCIGGACSLAGGSGRQHSINFYQAVGFTSTNIILPVKLLYFTATKTSNGIALNWASAEEVNLSGYVVEKSEDGINFSELAAVQSLGSNHSYTYTDNSQVQATNVFYRLKSIDIDGKVSYSQVVRISSDAANLQFLAVSPNPVINNFSATIQSGKKQQVEFRLINSEGKTLQSFKRMVLEGVSLVPVETANKLTKGIYFLQATSSEGAVQTIKVAVL